MVLLAWAYWQRGIETAGPTGGADETPHVGLTPGIRGALCPVSCVLDAPPPLRAAVGASVSSVFALSENSFVGVCQVICPYVLTLLTRKMH